MNFLCRGVQSEKIFKIQRKYPIFKKILLTETSETNMGTPYSLVFVFALHESFFEILWLQNETGNSNIHFVIKLRRPT